MKVYLDNFNEAKGTLYLDDGESFNYKNGEFIYNQFIYQEKQFKFQSLNLNELKSKENYLEKSEFKNLKFDTISIIGSELTNEKLDWKYELIN